MYSAINIDSPITIIIPTYNRAKYIRRCLDSIFLSSYEKFRIFVSDNCSSDETPEVLASFSDSRLISWRNEANLGADRNIMRLIEKVDSGFILFLTDDVWVEPRAIGELAKLVNEKPEVGGILSRLRCHSEANGKVFHDQMPSVDMDKQWFRIFKAGADALHHLFPLCNSFCRQVVRRDLIDLEGFQRQIDNNVLYAQMWLAGSAMLQADFMYTPQVFVNVAVHNKSFWNYPADYGVLSQLGMIRDLTNRSDMHEIQDYLVNNLINDLPSKIYHAHAESPHKANTLIRILWDNEFFRQRDDFRQVFQKIGIRIPQ